MRRCLFALLLALLLLPTAAQAAVTEDGLWYAEPDEFRETAETVSLLAAGETVTLEGVTYALGADGTAAVAGYTAAIPARCAIPASITVGGQSYAVTSIAQSGLYNCSALTSITLPDSLTSIGAYALAGCTKLTTLTIPANVISIGTEAFSNCSALTAINVVEGNTVYRSRDGVLFGPADFYVDRPINANNALLCYPQNRPGDTYTVPAEVQGVGDRAFANAVNLSHVTISSDTVAIGTEAFAGSSLSSISLSQVRAVDSDAFAECRNLTAITIPATLTEMDLSVFRGATALASFTVSKANARFFTDGTALYCRDYTYYVDGNDDDSTGQALVAYAPAAANTSYTVADGTACIAENAFWEAGNLQSITLPAGLTCIEFGAFTSTGLISADLPDTVKTLNVCAFQCCDQLRSVTLGGITALYEGTFASCPALTSITLPSTVESVDSRALESCPALAEIHLEAGSEHFTVVNNVLYGCAFVLDENGEVIDTTLTSLCLFPAVGYTTYTLPASVTEVGYGVFASAEDLKTINVEDGNSRYYAEDGVLYERTGEVDAWAAWDLFGEELAPEEEGNGPDIPPLDLGVSLHTYPLGKAIPGGAFTSPGAVTTLAPHAFEKHSGLISIDTGSVRYIRKSALHTWSLTDVTLGNSVERVGQMALFATGVTHVTFPKNVVFVGDQSLDWCDELEYITFRGETPPVFDYLFCNNSSALRYIYVPESEGNSVQVAYKAAMGGKVYPGAMIVTGTYKSADTVKEQVAQLGSDSTQKAVNDAATALVRLTTDDMAQVSDEEISKVDELFQEKNEVSVNVQKAEEAPDVSVSGLALASGLTEQAAAGETIQDATVALAVTKAEPQTDNDLLGLSFTMTVNGAVTQPASPVVITVPMTEEMTAAGDSLELVHIADNGEEENVDYTVSDGKATFRADSFSSYVFRTTAPVDPAVEYNTTGEAATLIVAWYSYEGKLFSYSVYDVTGSGKEELSIREGARCRAFLLDSQGRPTGTVKLYGVPQL